MATKREELEMAIAGKGCLGKAADDEPVFILRGQDLLAAACVRDWAQRARIYGCRTDKIEEAIALAERMDAWPTRKYPD